MKKSLPFVIAGVFLFIFCLGGCGRAASLNTGTHANVFLAETQSLITPQPPDDFMPTMPEAWQPEIIGVLADNANAQDVLQQIPEAKKYQAVVILSSRTLNILQKKVADIFPNAHIQIFPIMAWQQVHQIADQLAKTLPPESLIIIEANPEFSHDKLAHEFQEHFYDDVIQHFEDKKFANLPQQISFPLQTFTAFIKAKNQEPIYFEPMSSIGQPLAGFFTKKMDTNSPSSGDKRPIFLTFFGDIMLGRDVRNLMNKNGLDYPFQKMDLKYLKVNDLLVANLEGPIARDAVKTSKTIAFRFLPDTAPLLKKYFFDVLSQANNHALDMGVQGYESTRELLQQQDIVPFGDPKAIGQNNVATLTIADQKIAFFGVEEVTYKINDQKTMEKIKALKAQGYKVIVFPHWGIEYQHEPNARQQQLAHEFIDAGATAVIGAHPHVVESYENYNGHPIFYSLGNGIFDQYFSPDTQEGLSLAMELSDESIVFYLLPIKIEKAQMRLMNESERKNFLEKFVSWGKHTTEEQAALKSGKLVLFSGGTF